MSYVGRRDVDIFNWRIMVDLDFGKISAFEYATLDVDKVVN